jgi:hypothetical protein
MWKPRRLRKLSASTTRYRDSFTFTISCKWFNSKWPIRHKHLCCCLCFDWNYSMPTPTSVSGTRVFVLVGVRRVCSALIFQPQPSVRYRLRTLTKIIWDRIIWREFIFVRRGLSGELLLNCGWTCPVRGAEVTLLSHWLHRIYERELPSSGNKLISRLLRIYTFSAPLNKKRGF